MKNINFLLVSVIFIALICNGCSKSDTNIITTPVTPSVYGSVTDVEGNIYKTVTIGNQTWMAENLKTTKYNDGTSIPNVTNSVSWLALTTPAYCWYGNDVANKNTYGAFYNWYTIKTNKLCPIGWHVPTKEDWAALKAFLGGEEISGSKLKINKASVPGWDFPNAGSTNSTGFSALPCGWRNYSGDFTSSELEGCWWTSLEWFEFKTYAYYQFVTYLTNYLSGGVRRKFAGLSVRCIKD